jgi:hypothetical protein
MIMVSRLKRAIRRATRRLIIRRALDTKCLCFNQLHEQTTEEHERRGRVYGIVLYARV